MTGWLVFSSWQGIPDRVLGLWAGPETCEEFDTWPLARRRARQMCCLNGVRYVSVQDADDVVAAEYDRYTGRWREYRTEER